MSKVSEMLPEDLRSTFSDTMPDNWPDVLENRAGASYLNDTKGTRDLLLATAVYLRQSRSASTPAKAVMVTDAVVEAAAMHLCENMCRTYWQTLPEESSEDQGYPAWKVGGRAAAGKEDFRRLVRAALSALEDAPQQEPVAWLIEDLQGWTFAVSTKASAEYAERRGWKVTPLYALSHPSTPAKNGLFPIANKAGKEPCGECRLQPGEVCDICGASSPSTPATGSEV